VFWLKSDKITDTLRKDPNALLENILLFGVAMGVMPQPSYSLISQQFMA
jgi:hypothetical protein